MTKPFEDTEVMFGKHLFDAALGLFHRLNNRDIAPEARPGPNLLTTGQWCFSRSLCSNCGMKTMCSRLTLIRRWLDTRKAKLCEIREMFAGGQLLASAGT